MHRACARTTRHLMSFSVTSFVATATPTPRPRGVGSDPADSVPRMRVAFPCGPFPRARAVVRLSSCHNRRLHPDAAVELGIAQRWQALQQSSPRVFNATKFRLHRWRLDASAQRLELLCGLTDYRTYVGACCGDEALVARLQADARDTAYTRRDSRTDGDGGDDGDDDGAFLSRKLGVSALLETADSQLVLIQRSRHVGLYQGLVDTPGGHPEPSDVALTEEQLKVLETPANADEKLRMELAALDRIYDSIVEEVHEEINVAADALSDPLLLGIVSQSHAKTPSLVHSADQVLELYQSGPQDQFESSQLLLVDVNEAIRIAGSPSQIVSIVSRTTGECTEHELTPAAIGSLKLFQQYNALTRS